MILLDEMPARAACEAPDEFPHTSRAPAVETRCSILALDLGTKLGWATVDRNGAVRSGSLKCLPRGNEAIGQRWSKFRGLLSDLSIEVCDFDAVYFEQVQRHAGTIAAHVYGGFLAHLEHWCAARNAEPIGVGVGEVKKAWTGNGAAKKHLMIAMAEQRGFRPADDNEADALAILSLAISRESAR